MPVTICRNARDNHWSSQKLSMEKNTIGNEPYIEKGIIKVVEGLPNLLRVFREGLA